MCSRVQVLSRLQLAQASVTCYPYFPDPLKMSEVVEEEMRSTATDASGSACAGGHGDTSS